MIEFRIGERKVRPEDLADSMEAAMLENLKEELRTKIGSLRDPKTGEFPTVIVTGPSIDQLSVTVEGSDRVIAMVEERLSENTDDVPNVEDEPVVFVCHGSEDKKIARRLATDLRSHGIDGFFDEWEIRSGDSLRQKIDAGVERCTHFLVILSKASMSKPWVNAEMDAGFMMRMSGKAKFIALRLGVAPEELAPLLQGLHSPSLERYESALEQLVSDIHGLSRKPALGSPPATKAAATGKLGLSPAAESIVKLFVDRSEHGLPHTPFLEVADLKKHTGLTDDDLVDAVDELKGQEYVSNKNRLGCEIVTPEGALFGEFDSFFKPWSPSDDALVVASHLLEAFASKRRLVVGDVSEKLGWQPRRMNPAIHYLLRRNAVEIHRGYRSRCWTYDLLSAIPETRRFAKSRGR